MSNCSRFSSPSDSNSDVTAEELLDELNVKLKELGAPTWQEIDVRADSGETGTDGKAVYHKVIEISSAIEDAAVDQVLGPFEERSTGDLQEYLDVLDRFGNDTTKSEFEQTQAKFERRTQPLTEQQVFDIRARIAALTADDITL